MTSTVPTAEQTGASDINWDTSDMSSENITYMYYDFSLY